MYLPGRYEIPVCGHLEDFLSCNLLIAWIKGASLFASIIQPVPKIGCSVAEDF